MAEILVRAEVNIWDRKQRPDIFWVTVARKTVNAVHYKIRREKDGEITEELRMISRKKLDRVAYDRHGAATVYWLQDDSEPIINGEKYCLAMMDVLSRINEDLRRAAENARDMEEALERNFK